MCRLAPCLLLVALVAAACVERALDPAPGDASRDLAVGPGDGGGGRVDLARPVDLARAPDLRPPQGGCFEIIECMQACQTDPCFFQCYEDASMSGQAAFDAYTGCLELECGGICAGAETACDACLEDVQAAPGTCGAMRPRCGRCRTETVACSP